MKQWLIRKLTEHLFVMITDDDILRISNGKYIINKHQLTQEEVHQLKEESEAITTSFLWKIATNELKYIANLTMFEKSKTADDLIFGKAMLKNLELLEKFFERLKNMP